MNRQRFLASLGLEGALDDGIDPHSRFAVSEIEILAVVIARSIGLVGEFQEDHPFLVPHVIIRNVIVIFSGDVISPFPGDDGQALPPAAGQVIGTGRRIRRRRIDALGCGQGSLRRRRIEARFQVQAGQPDVVFQGPDHRVEFRSGFQVRNIQIVRLCLGEKGTAERAAHHRSHAEGLIDSASGHLQANTFPYLGGGNGLAAVESEIGDICVAGGKVLDALIGPEDRRHRRFQIGVASLQISHLLPVVHAGRRLGEAPQQVNDPADLAGIERGIEVLVGELVQHGDGRVDVEVDGIGIFGSDPLVFDDQGGHADVARRVEHQALALIGFQLLAAQPEQQTGHDEQHFRDSHPVTSAG